MIFVYPDAGPSLIPDTGTKSNVKICNCKMKIVSEESYILIDTGAANKSEL